MKAIQTLGLTKVYRDHTAVNRVNLSVQRGEIFGLLGPNGAGKSTLVKMLVGLVHPSAGGARVLGLSLSDLSYRRHMGYLPELFRYQPWLTAEEVLSFHARLLTTPWREEDSASLLARVGLKSRGRLRSYSKGMQQRLGLAVALVGNPEIIFLDEPTSALDPIGRHQVSELLRALKAEGHTIFLNSHLLSDVEKVCDSVGLIDQGQMIFQGSLHEAIYGGLRHYRVVVGRFETFHEPLMVQIQPTAMIQWGEDHTEIDVQLVREDLPKLVQWLVSQGIEVYEVQPDHSRLEEWFLRRLGKDTP